MITGNMALIQVSEPGGEAGKRWVCATGGGWKEVRGLRASVITVCSWWSIWWKSKWWLLAPLSTSLNTFPYW